MDGNCRVETMLQAIVRKLGANLISLPHRGNLQPHSVKSARMIQFS